LKSICHLSLIMSQISPAHASPSHILKIHFNIILLSMPKSCKRSLSPCLPTKMPYSSLLSPIHAKCSTHLILLDLIIRKIIGEEYMSSSFSLCSILHSPVTLSLSDPNIFLCTLFSNTVSLCSSLNVIEQVLHPY